LEFLLALELLVQAGWLVRGLLDEHTRLEGAIAGGVPEVHHPGECLADEGLEGFVLSLVVLELRDQEGQDVSHLGFTVAFLAGGENEVRHGAEEVGHPVQERHALELVHLEADRVAETDRTLDQFPDVLDVLLALHLDACLVAQHQLAVRIHRVLAKALVGEDLAAHLVVEFDQRKLLGIRDPVLRIHFALTQREQLRHAFVAEHHVLRVLAQADQVQRQLDAFTHVFLELLEVLRLAQRVHMYLVH